jgi:tetratricopeptide (TPR) repeat protein
MHYRACQIIFVIAVVAKVLLEFLRPASGQDQQQIDWCNGKNQATFDMQIMGCTAIIQSGKYTDRQLAIVFDRRGSAYVWKDDYDRAIEDFDRAIRLDPTYASGFLDRGMAFHNKKAYGRAMSDYSEAIRLNPKLANAFTNRCWVRAIIGELQAALVDCNQSLQLQSNNPSDPYIFDRRGFTYLKLGRFEEAISDYNTMIRRVPNYAGSLYGRGIAKIKKGDTTAGNADISAAKAIKPDIAVSFKAYGVD